MGALHSYTPFYNIKTLKSLTLGNHVTNIINYAFYGCSSLTSVNIPNSVTTIGTGAFYGCSALTSITIPNNVINIGSYAFYACSNLTSISIPNNISSINSYTFSGCSSLTSVTIPHEVKTIGESAFKDCSALTSLSIPNSVANIEYYAFDNCTSLAELYIEDGDSILSVGVNALNGEYYSYSGEGLFYDCPLEEVYLGRDLKYLEKRNFAYSPFYYNTKLKSLIIGKKVTNIGKYAFKYCISLTSVTIPSSVSIIDDNAFESCGSLKELYIEDGDSELMLGYNFGGQSGTYLNTSYALFNSCPLETIYLGRNINYSSSAKDYPAFRNKDKLASLTISNNVTSIGNSAFSGCSVLTSLTIPGSVTSIGNNAFYGCSSLNKVSFEDGDLELSLGYNIVSSNSYPYNSTSSGLFSSSKLDSVYLGRDIIKCGYSPFLNQSKLSSVIISNKVKYICSHAFEGCTSLPKVIIPNSVTKIDNFAFNGCTSLKELNFEDGGSTLSLGYNSNSSSKGLGLLYDCPLERIYLGRDITYSTEKANGYSPFYGNTTLNSVTIGNTVTKIEDYAFGDCSSLKFVKIGSGVLSIGSNQSAPIKTIWMTNTPPVGMKNLEGSINYVANKNYTDLDNVYVYPYLSSLFEVDGIKYVPVIPSKRTCDAIDCSDTVVNVRINETVSYRNVAMKVEKVMPYTAYNNTLAETVSISHKGNIGSKAFMNCSGLSSLTLGDNVTSIDNDAFKNCTALPKVTLGTNTTSIGNGAFMDCTALSELTLCDNLTSIGNSSFQGCTQLSEVVIPGQTTMLGDSCFYGNTLLADIDLGDGVKTIGQYCFDSSIIPTISIPSSVTNIGDYAFNKCTSLADVIINDRKSELTLGSNGSSPLFASCPLDSVYIGGKIKYNTSSSFGYSPFYRNTSLHTIVITDKEEEIYDNEFYGCTNLKNVTLGNGVKKIGNWAFSGCSNLDYFNFGSGMQSIGNEAFSDCTKLTKLISYAEVPPTCGNMALDDINKWDCTLQIPLNCLDAYLSADQWMEFFFIDDVLTKEELPDEYNLNVSAVGYATLFLDFNAEIPAGVEVYVANKVVGNRLKMERVEGVLPANTGVIVLANEGTYTFEESETTPATIETNLLKGTVVNTMITADPSYSYYVLSNVDGVVAMYLAKLTDDKFLNNANKAYLSLKKGDLNIDDNEEVDTNVAQMSRRFIFDFGNATGIDELKAENGNVKAETFDLSGRRVQNATKGIYIQNGKIMIK